MSRNTPDFPNSPEHIRRCTVCGTRYSSMFMDTPCPACEFDAKTKAIADAAKVAHDDA